jgi:hypothetical protein
MTEKVSILRKKERKTGAKRNKLEAGDPCWLWFLVFLAFS